MRRSLLLWVAVLLAGLAAGRDAFDRWVDRTALAPHAVAQSVEVLDREGRLLRAYTVDDGLWRLPVRLDQVDPLYLRMLIAYEDKRFYRHRGVDPWSLGRAAALALRYGRLVSGGSTLTMQVARLLEDGTTGQFDGKLRQMRVAWALERQLTKDEILTLYVNLAPFGGNLEGLRSATFAYFGKEPHRLTPAQAALLVALPQAPSSRRPDRAPDKARAGRDRVLRKAQGAGVISQDTAQAARRDPVPHHRTPFPSNAAHLSDRMRAQAPLTTQHRTTIDRDLQAALERLAQATVAGLDPAISVAIVVADHGSGAMVAHLGAANYTSDARHGWVDMTIAKRSPGSTLKPLIYGLGFDLGLIAPRTVMQDRPMSFSGYSPGNFDGLFRGPVRVDDALRQSLNLPAIALTKVIGPARLLARLRRGGVDPVLQGDGTPGLAIALGGLGLTLEELVTLYGALARGGDAQPLHWSEPGAPALGPVLSEASAASLVRILAQNPPPAHGARRDLAYKTGTSYGNRDAWAIGFNGRFVAGVWVGRADSTAVPDLSGADHAAPLLFEAMQRVDPAATPFGPLPTQRGGPLPPHLRQFGGPGDDDPSHQSAPDLTFPQDGTTIVLDETLALKVRRGTPPFTWLINDRPAILSARRRSITIDGIAAGPARISVIDAKGRSDSVEVILDR